MRFLEKWVATFEREGVIVESRRGKHSKTVSPIMEIEFRDNFISHVRSESCKKGSYISKITQNFFWN